MSKVLTDDNGNLELLDTVTDGDKLAGTPDEALHLNRAHRLFELRHVGLVVPRLDLECNNRLKRMSEDMVEKKRMERTLAAVFGLRAFFAL